MTQTEQDHAAMVRLLAKDGEIILSELTPEDCHNLHMIIGIDGEVGELTDAVKKAVFYRRELDRENVIEELGDIEFYLQGLRQGFGITREETLAANMSKLGVRYEGFQYSDQAAKERADKIDA